VKDSRDDTGGTLFLPRNFTVDPAERVRALAAGPPAYVLRRRRIEDLEAAVVRSIRVHEAKEPVNPREPPLAIAKSLSHLYRLIDAHNRFYPVEASLPIDVATGALLDFGRPWKPLVAPTIDELMARARAR
jgi:hypothetical protein